MSTAPARSLAPTPAQALALLQEGNARWVAGRCEHPRLTPAHRQALAQSGQHPFAAVLGCSDSRVPVELLFDQGAGDLFVVRVAGFVCGDTQLASLEYAAVHLQVPLCVVLGHTDCGAVSAAVDGLPAEGHLSVMLGSIEAAVHAARRQQPLLHGRALAPAATEANIWHSLEAILTRSFELRSRVQAHKLTVVGALYDLATGEVAWLGEHPRQGELT